jgi:hypothetical protein
MSGYVVEEGDEDALYVIPVEAKKFSISRRRFPTCRLYVQLSKWEVPEPARVGGNVDR